MGISDRARRAVGRGIVNGLGLWERLESGLFFNPTGADFIENPHPLYRRLREERPVHRSRLTRGWVFSGYDDVRELFGDRRLSSDFRHGRDWARIRRAQLRAGASESELENPSMLSSDPPRHTRLRGLVNKAFTPRAVKALERRMREIADELLDARGDATEIDVVGALAYPLPVTVIAELLGVPSEDRERFRHWSDEAVRSLGSDAGEDLRASIRAVRELEAYLEPIVAERRREPRDDLLSALIAAEEDGERLDEGEIYQMVVLLLVAGNETTTKMIGNGLLALLRHPDQLARLREEPGLMETAVEELLRWDGPVHMTARIAVQDLSFKTTRIGRGEMVILAMAAANRDPEEFHDPEILDVGRTPNNHLSFGHGIHFCLGSSLARLETRVALDALLDRYPRIELARERPPWGSNTALRGVSQLPVRVARSS